MKVKVHLRACACALIVKTRVRKSELDHSGVATSQCVDFQSGVCGCMGTSLDLCVDFHAQCVMVGRSEKASCSSSSSLGLIPLINLCPSYMCLWRALGVLNLHRSLGLSMNGLEGTGMMAYNNNTMCIPIQIRCRLHMILLLTLCCKFHGLVRTFIKCTIRKPH